MSSVSTVTLDASCHHTPPSTPIQLQPVTSTPSDAPSPLKQGVISPLPPPLSPQTHQLVSHNPQLASIIAEQLKLACLQQLINNTSNQLLVQPAPVTPNIHTPSVCEAQQIPVMMQTEVKNELSDTLIIPASPPMDDNNTEISSYCESPPLFSSPVKQPLTSTQIDGDFETIQLDKLSRGCGPETLDTEAVKLEQCDTVVSLSSQGIELPQNPTACDQSDSTKNNTVVAEESFPEQQRQSSRKRNATHKIINYRHTQKRQHRKQLV